MRFGIDGPGAAASSQDLSYAALGLVIGIVWIIALWAARTREHRIIGIGLREYQRVANATLGTFGVLAIVAFIARGSTSPADTWRSRFPPGSCCSCSGG